MPSPPGAGSGKAHTKLKPLHWDKVNLPRAEHSMVWDKITNGSFRFDDDLMEALFGTVATNRKSPNSNKGPSNPFGSPSDSASSPAQICLLDPRKSQNIAIVIRTLAVSRQEILDGLLEGRGLSPDTLEKLSRVAPTKDEEAQILGFAGNPSRLADAESFLFHLLRAVPSPFARLDAMLFRSNYEPEILHVRMSLQALELACKELRTHGLFPKLLEAILKAGNRMNAGTARGNAQAFNLTALCKLSDVKSTDRTTTLLHFVVEEVVRSEGKRCVINHNHSVRRTISRKNSSGAGHADPASSQREEREKEYMMLGLPVVGGLSTEFANVKKAAAIDYDALVGASAVLGARVAETHSFLGTCGGGDGFVKEMKGFLEAAAAEVEAVRGEQARVMELVVRTTEYYQAGAAKDRGAQPLQLFVIVRDFLAIVDKVCVDLARNLQKKKPAAAAGGGGDSPTASERGRRTPAQFPNLPAHFMSDNSKSPTTSDSEDGF